MHETSRLRAEEKFKEFNLAYERLQEWIEERDQHLEQTLKEGTHPSQVRDAQLRKNMEKGEF